jgi:hypothetical protein
MRAFLRFVGFILLTGGFVAFVIDGARGIANSEFVFTPLAITLGASVPSLFPGLEPWVASSVPASLQHLAEGSLLTWPTWIVGTVLGIALLWLGRRPPEPFRFKPLR